MAECADFLLSYIIYSSFLAKDRELCSPALAIAQAAVEGTYNVPWQSTTQYTTVDVGASI